MKKYIALLAIIGLTSTSLVNAEGNIANGFALSAACTACHDSLWYRDN